MGPRVVDVYRSSRNRHEHPEIAFHPQGYLTKQQPLVSQSLLELTLVDFGDSFAVKMAVRKLDSLTEAGRDT